MNYYERIQLSIDFIERNILEDIKVEDVAKEAYMSVSNFHRMFFAITGYKVMEYIRCRRISLAAKDIEIGKERILDIAIKYSYDTSDSFSRAFKSVTGILPSKYVRSKVKYEFEKINILDKYFNLDCKEDLDKYPDIKILKNLEPMRVAFYCYYGKNPEDGAFKIIGQWIKRNNIDINCGNYRIFGYNAEDSDPSCEEYGYEVCITIPKDYIVKDNKIKTKYLDGGLYVVTAVNKQGELGEEIFKAWQRFQKWLEVSKYEYGNRQWLEEHLGFNKENEHIGGVDLYMPITLKKGV